MSQDTEVRRAGEGEPIYLSTHLPIHPLNNKAPIFKHQLKSKSIIMKKIKYILILCFFYSLTGFSQLTDGSIAPDFTATDINGQEHNLYELLDQGHSVIVEFFATWCEPCWILHEVGNMKNIYEELGPDGSNEVYIFAIESDGTTTMNDLYGTGSSTFGDFITDTPYPIIDDASIADNYNVVGFPTIYHVCPDRTTTNIFNDPLTPQFIGLRHDLCSQLAGADNASLTAYEGPEGEVCGNKTFEPTVRFQNQGMNEITSASIKLSIGGNDIQTVQFNGSLGGFDFEDITFDEITIDDDVTLLFSIETVNNNDDIYPDANEIDVELLPVNREIETLQLTFNMFTGTWGRTLYVVLRDIDGTVYFEAGNPDIGASGGGQGIIDLWSNPEPDALDFNSIVNANITLPSDGCYKFAIYDDEGNGFDWGENAYYELNTFDGEVLAYADGEDWNNFAAVDQTSFIVNTGTTNTNDLEKDISEFVISPNPVLHEGNVQLNLGKEALITVQISNTLGQPLQSFQQQFSKGENSFSFDTANLTSNIYILTLMDERGNSSTKKFVVQQ